jgi:hypothetical protein
MQQKHSSSTKHSEDEKSITDVHTTILFPAFGVSHAKVYSIGNPEITPSAFVTASPSLMTFMGSVYWFAHVYVLDDLFGTQTISKITYLSTAWQGNRGD